MKKSLIAVLVLAAVAGTSGVLIGMAVARMRHRSAPGLAANSGIAAMAGGASDISAKPDEQGEVIRFAKDPSPAPPFLVNDLSGHTVSTAQLQGKVVIVNF